MEDDKSTYIHKRYKLFMKDSYKLAIIPVIIVLGVTGFIMLDSGDKESNEDSLRILDENSTVDVYRGFDHDQYRFPYNGSFTLRNNDTEDIGFNVTSDQIESNLTIRGSTTYELITGSSVNVTVEQHASLNSSDRAEFVMINETNN